MPSRPIRCAVWIVEQMRYRPTDQPTDTASYRGALSHLKSIGVLSPLLSAPDQKDWKIVRSIADSFVVKPRTVEMTLITLESFAIGIKTEFRVEFISGEFFDVGRRNRVSQHDDAADAIR